MIEEAVELLLQATANAAKYAPGSRFGRRSPSTFRRMKRRDLLRGRPSTRGSVSRVESSCGMLYFAFAPAVLERRVRGLPRAHRTREPA